MNIRTIVLSFLFLTGISITTYSQTSFGLRGGVNFQNLNGKDAGGDKLENKLKVGFNAGVTVDVPVASPDYFVQTGLLFSTKGAKIEGFGNDAKVNLSYLEVPVTFLYKPALGEGKLLLGVGPYFGFAVGGKVEDEDIKFEKKITLAQASSGVPYFKRFDAGGNIIFGYQFTDNFSAQLNSQLGLVNINPEVESVSDDTRVRNTGFGVSVGYHF
jgi:hypothetical protein